MNNNTLDNIKINVIKALENNGIIVKIENDGDAFLDISAIDSITFISFIIDIESTFEIVFPDEFLSLMIIQSLNGVVHMLSELITEKSDNDVMQ